MKSELEQLKYYTDKSLELATKVRLQLKSYGSSTRLRTNMVGAVCNYLEEMQAIVSTTLDLNSRTVNDICIDKDIEAKKKKRKI